MATAALTTCLGVGPWASRARASIAVALSLEALAAEASHVVLVEAQHAEARWDTRGRIVTDTTVRVIERYEGEAAEGALLVVRTLGGEIGDLGMRVPGAGHIPPGSRALLFLEPRVGSSTLRPVGMSQGILPVRAGPGGVDEVLPGGAGLHLVGPNGREPAPPALAGPTPLPLVRDVVRSAVEATRVR